MKKLFLILMAFCTLLISGTALAEGYTNYLNGDSNFIFVDGHMGSASYLDRSSLAVEKYAPPQYIIAVNVCTVPNADKGNTAISKVKTYRFFYNWNNREMYVDNTGNSNWRYLRPLASRAETSIVMPAGEMAFYLAYKMKFYGAQKWYHRFLEEYVDVFDNNFYRLAS